MSRPEPIRHAGLVPKLIAAIESRGRAAAPVSRSRRRDLAELKPTTVYSALAHELGQRPEAVRQELRKFRLRERTPRAQKIVALVDAATALGWIDAPATGTGAEVLVAWCRTEVERRKAEHGERDRKAAARRRGTMERRVQELVAQMFDESGLMGSDDELGTSVVAQLVHAFVESALAEFGARQKWFDAGSAKRLRDAGSEARKRMHAEATRVAGAWHRQRIDEAEARAAVLDEFHDREIATRHLQRAAELGDVRLAERALKLGIGRGQLNRILDGLAGGGLSRLSAEDARRCRELLGGVVLRRR